MKIKDGLRILRKIYVIIGLSIFLCFIIFLSSNIFNNMNAQRKRCTEKVIGVVVDYDTEYFDDEESYTAVYEYQYNLATHRGHTNIYSGTIPDKGQKKVIYINPNNFEEVYIDSFINYIPFIIFGIFLVMIIIIFIKEIFMK
ncbi:MAG: hypothetical protein SOY42_13610 [Clostridium sp.]|nr:hypothetical protein [Clostridium sp.]